MLSEIPYTIRSKYLCQGIDIKKGKYLEVDMKKIRLSISLILLGFLVLSSCDKKDAFLVNRRTATPEKIEEIKKAERVEAERVEAENKRTADQEAEKKRKEEEKEEERKRAKVTPTTTNTTNNGNDTKTTTNTVTPTMTMTPITATPI
ncbi:hypothetical protein AGMMS50222_10290 [Endomicrobiia bacterium]|nr:hypothetical protein AGMMS50222_10290 [Endomicrobiia bacterium]